MTHPLVSRIAKMMDDDLTKAHLLVAEWVLSCPSDSERAAFRYFGAELGAVQRRIRSREAPPTAEEIEIALTAVLALVNRRVNAQQEPS